MADYGQRKYKDLEEPFVLPPKFDSESTTIHGFLTVKIGKIVWIKTPGGAEGTKLRLKFWGEDGQGTFLAASNSSSELKDAFPSHITYQVRTSIMNFSKYLEDMQMIKLFVLDSRNDKAIGVANINMLIFMKRNVSEKHSSPFQDIKDVFPVVTLGNPGRGHRTSGNQKLGDIEVEITCLFQSELAPQNRVLMPISAWASDRKKPAEAVDDHLDSSFLLNETRAKESAEKHKENENSLYEDRFKANTITNPDDRIANSLRQNSKGFLSYTPNPYSFSEPPEPHTTIQPHVRSPQQVRVPADYMGREGMVSGGEYRGQGEDNKATQRKLDEVLRRGKLLQEKMSSKHEEFGMFHSPGSGMGNVFEQIPMGDAAFKHRVYDYPIEKIGDVLKQGPDAKFDPEIEEQRLMFDEVAIMGADPRSESEGRQLRNIDTLKIHIGEFDCKNEVMLPRINAKSVFLECEIPNVFPETMTLSPNTLKISSKQMCGNHLFFQHDFFQKLVITEATQDLWLQSHIVFKLCAYAYTDKAPGNNVTMELGRGEFRLSSLFNAQNLSGSYLLSMFSRAPVDIPEKPEGKKPTKADKAGTRIVKKESALKKIEGEVFIGDLHVGLSLLSISRKAPQRSDSPTPGTPSDGTKRRAELDGNQATNFSALNFQMLLYLEKTMNISTPQSRSRNVFIRFKVYGTSEVIESPIFWGESNPVLGHKMILPLSFELIQKMQKVPLMIEVWDRSQAGDELLGLVRLNLSAIPGTLFDEGSGLLNTGLIKNNIHPVIIHDGMTAISDLKSGRNVGLLQVLVAFGTVSQVHKFESRMQAAAKPPEDMGKQPVPKSPIKEGTGDRFGLSNEKDLRMTNEFLSNSQRKPDQRGTFENLRLNDKADSPFNLSTKAILIQIFEQIRKDNNKHIGTLRNFLQTFEHQKRDPSIREFNTFLKSLEFSEAIALAAVGILDYRQSGVVANKYFLGSYNAYKILQDEIRTTFANNLNELRGALNKRGIKLKDLEKRLTEKSEFGYLKRPLFVDALRELNTGASLGAITKIADYLDFCDDEYIFATELLDSLRALDVYEDLNFVKINISELAGAVNSKLSSFLLNGGIQLDSLFHKQELFNRNLDIEEILHLMNSIGLKMSFLEALLLIDLIKKRYLITGLQEWEISYTHFYDFLAFTLNRARAEEELSRRQEDRRDQPVGFEQRREEDASNHESAEEDVLDIASILNNKGTKELRPPICNGGPTREDNNLGPKPDPRRGGIEDGPINQKPEREQEIKPVDHEIEGKINFIRHSFDIKLHKAKDLQNQGLLKEGSYSFKYTFPLTEEVIESTPFDYEYSSSKYLIDYRSKHTVSLGKAESLKHILKQSNKGILIKLCQREEYFDQPIAYCLIPTEDIIESLKQPEDSGKCKKTYILYCIDSGLAQKAADVEPIIGKLTVILRYSRSEVEKSEGSEVRGAETLMEKETQILRMLPKQGTLSIELLSLSNFKRALAGQAAVSSPKAEFFTTVYFDCFADSEELSQIFPAFETEPVHNLFEYQNFHVEKYDVNLTEDIINYFKDGAMHAELRLYKAEEEGEEQENKKNYVKLGQLKLPCLQLIINPEGIKGEFEVSNMRGGKVCSLCLNVTFQKEPKTGHLGRGETRCNNAKRKTKTKFLLGLYEVLNYSAKEEVSERLRFQSEKKEDLLIYFTFRVGGTVHKSNTYKCHSSSRLLSIDDSLFPFDCADLEKDERDALEIKIFSKSRSEREDSLFGYVNIDFPQIRSKVDPRGFWHSSFYSTVFGSAGSKLHCQRVRVGIKLIGVNLDVMENPALFSELSHVFAKKNLRAVEDTLRTNQLSTTRSYFETIKQTGKKLTANEMEGLMRFFPRLTPEEAKSVFSANISPHLDFQTEPVKKSVLDEIFNDFSFFDYENTGFIELESAIRALLPYESSFKSINRELLKRFTPEGAGCAADANISLISARNKFDYVVFMRKVSFPEAASTETVSQLYEKIFNNSKKIDDFYGRKLKQGNEGEDTFVGARPEPEEDDVQSIYLTIEIVSGQNMQTLTENGLPPNCYVVVENKICSIQSDMSYRVGNPLWNNKKTFKIEKKNAEKVKEIEASIFQRSYNDNSGKSLYNDFVIGKTTFNLEKFLLSRRKDQALLLEGKIKSALKKEGKSEGASILLKFDVEERRPTPQRKRAEFEEEAEMAGAPNDLSQDLIENFHKTLNEVYKDVQAEKERSDKKISKRLKDFEKDYSPERVKEREYFERSSRKKDMKQTLDDLDNLTINLNKMLTEGGQSFESRHAKGDSSLKTAHEGGNLNKDNFSFGKLNEEDKGWKTSSFSDENSRRKLEFTDDSNKGAIRQNLPGNPFENYLDKTVPNHLRERKPSSDDDNGKRKPENRTNSRRGSEEEKALGGTDKPDENLISADKPPIKRTSSLSRIKKMEQKLNFTVKDNKELDRISKIMKQDFSKSKNMYNFSSDSDS